MSIARRSTQPLARLAAVLLVLSSASSVAAQAPSAPPPSWDSQIGAAFVGTAGNTDTSTVGADFAANRRWPVWQIALTAGAVRTSDDGERTAERYVAASRAQRTLTQYLSFTAGEKAERDQLAGMAFRNILDAGLSWVLLRRPRWTLEGLTSVAWVHEEPVESPATNSPAGVFQLLSRVPFGSGADTTQRLTHYPNFEVSSAYRSEAEITAQAAMNDRLALKFGYLLRYSNQPVIGFEKTDSTATASIVIGWRSEGSAP